jgi:hypothetical protein
LGCWILGLVAVSFTSLEALAEGNWANGNGIGVYTLRGSTSSPKASSSLDSFWKKSLPVSTHQFLSAHSSQGQAHHKQDVGIQRLSTKR